MKPKLVLVSALLVFLVTACTDSRPVTVLHSHRSAREDTSVQTGIRVRHLPEGHATSQGTRILGTYWIAHYIDGQLLARHNASEPIDTLAALSPGDHEYTYETLYKGPLSFWYLIQYSGARFRFDLTNEQVGVISTSGLLEVSADNFARWHAVP